ncbi:N-acetylmuramoyl-L-alanine amidase [Salipaludibacillus sp. HK11]|uniref:peptidoglycan recognition protein family protein n=1 Tax=Salipaludibacillus sp. HK11 TaxID=3394320 RepID=UPI0039FB99A7
MLLKNKYKIVQHLICNTKNRSRRKLQSRQFGVAHETANNTADAMAHVNYFQFQSVQASYHQLVDSQKIVQLIPNDEIALHVRRDLDRQTLGLGNANDNSIAISLCRTGSFAQAYDRYVWAWAKVCVENKWNPKQRITAHRFEDPNRRRDPQSWLEPNGISWPTFLNDVSVYVTSWEMDTAIKKSSTSTKHTAILRKGDKGDNVKELQERLICAGFDLPKYGTDGHFGEESEMALRLFQNKANIGVDGIFGVQSAKALDKTLASRINSLPATIYQATPPYPSGTGVKVVQEALASLGFHPNLSIKNKGIDGIYGPKTAAAIRRFQQIYLPHEVDGIYGPNTRRKLLELYKT